MSDTRAPVLQTVRLGMPWQTIDPFLFCVHHVDAYPAGNGRHGPAAPLAGRELGNDFAGVDGWRMYHGADVPGFPQHPHRGFETVTYVRRGLVDHSDSLGAAARFGRGDTQWLTAGRGIVHSETFPLTETGAPNPLELFQIWLNLPAEDKLAEPHFTMLWDEQTPRVRHVDQAGRVAEVTVIAGRLEGAEPLPAPPRSWASRPDSDVAIWHVHLDAGGSFTLPPAASDATVRTLYVFGEGGLEIGLEIGAEIGAGARATVVDGGHAAIVRVDEPLPISSPAGTDVLVLQGRPIGEPVAQYGPFVMNDQAGVQQAFADYRATGFGGWPWGSDEPVHDDAGGRFARYPDGHVDRPAAHASRSAAHATG